MSHKHIHIVSFDVPYPADYGGAIDVFYRLKALHSLGVKITLHCFEYGRGKQEELSKYTEQVHYYKRKKSVLDSVGKTPFIVKSRNSKYLLENLLLDDFPILFEGLHCCYFLDHPSLKNRTKIVRTHNIEHDYYDALAKTNSGLKKAFYSAESKKLKSYESQLKHADVILSIKQSDADHFKQYTNEVHVLRASSMTIKTGDQQATKPTCLFHGNLSVEENNNGANWLIETVFSDVNLTNKLIIAGKEPSEALAQKCSEHKVALISNPSGQDLNRLIQEARVHVFYTEQATGVKLKLINALNSSGQIIVNEKMVFGTNLSPFCSVKNDSTEFQNEVIAKLKTELSKEDFEARNMFLNASFNTVENCKLILEML